jgi:hypothetical protein
MGLDINIETKMTHIIINNNNLLHEDLNYSQMYSFVFNHDDKF